MEPVVYRIFSATHRVTEVTGKRERLQSIFGFNPKPGVKGSLETNILHYGPRVMEMES